MKNSLNLTKLAVVAVFVIVAIYSIGFATSPPEVVNLYNSKCAICHGADGSGNTATGKKLKVRDLRSADVQKMTDAQLAEIIGHGKTRCQPMKQ